MNLNPLLKFLKQIPSQGFTLIELLVVIAILGVLAVLLITVIDPIDKINSANDAGVVSAIAQFGKANDSYATMHEGKYVAGNNISTVNFALANLKNAGEIKTNSYTVPNGNYTAYYRKSPLTCTTAVNDCTDYAFIATGLQSKKYAATPIYQVVNGRGCTVATAITQAQLDTLSGSSSGGGACP